MEENKELAYDLRQKYAQIVGDHLEEISYSRRNKDYPEYFRGLENLFTIIKHKFKSKKVDDPEVFYELENKEEKKKVKKSDLERYKDIRQNAINIANKYNQTFLGQNDKSEEVAKVESVLREMEMFLYYVMDKAKMFGSVGYNEGM